MRQDFVFHVPVELAKRKAGEKKRKAILTSAMVTSFLFQAWLTGVVLLGAITVTNIVQRKGRC